MNLIYTGIGVKTRHYSTRGVTETVAKFFFSYTKKQSHDCSFVANASEFVFIFSIRIYTNCRDNRDCKT